MMLKWIKSESMEYQARNDRLQMIHYLYFFPAVAWTAADWSLVLRN